MLEPSRYASAIWANWEGWLQLWVTVYDGAEFLAFQRGPAQWANGDTRASAGTTPSDLQPTLQFSKDQEQISSMLTYS